MDKEHTNYPSRYALGEEVLFQPNFSILNNNSVRAKIVGIGFTESKILYDLALADERFESGFYEALPLRNVDSVMVLDLK